MKIEKVDSSDLSLLKNFLSTCGLSLARFRYYRTRPLSIIQNHLTTLLDINESNIPMVYGHLDKEDGKVWLGICVSEGNEGKGYGNFMMKALLEEAVKLKTDVIYLTVDKENYNALRLYENFGFKKVRESHTTIWYKWGN